MKKLSFLLFTIFIVFFSVHTISAQNKSFNLNDSSSGSLKSISISDNNSARIFQNASKSRELFINPIIQNNQSIQINDTIQLDLFENKQYKAYIDKIETDVNGTSVIRARLVDYEYGYCVISTFNEKSFMTVEVPEKNELYMSKYDHKMNKYYLLQIDKSRQKALEGASPIIPPNVDQQNNIIKKYNQQDLINLNPLKNAIINGENIAQNQSLITDPTTRDTISLMIIYTPAAASWSTANETDINNTISLLMAKAQLALDNSNTLMTIKLVYTAQVNYTELNNIEDLDNLTATDNGIMDEVHDWRDGYCADVVVLLENIDFAGGMAWHLNSTLGLPDYAFSINRVQQASSSFSIIHEIAHNMGAHHPKTQNSEPGPGLYSYSSGWRWNGTSGVKYCDVMTYEDGRYFADGISATIVPYFSNPNIQYQGVPTGDAIDGDNARTIRQMKSVVAAYRDRCSNCMPPTTQATAFKSSSITENSMTISWTRGNGNLVLVVARQINATKYKPVNGTSYTANASFGSGTQTGSENYVVYNGTGTSVNVTTLRSNTTYRYFIYEYNSASNCYLMTALSGNATTSDCTPPTTQATAFTISSITNSSMTIGWTRGSGNSVLVIARRIGNLPSVPNNGIHYTAENDFRKETQIGNYNYVVYNGTGTSVNIVNLRSGTNYNFDIYEYNSASNCYFLPALNGNATTLGTQWVQTNGPVGGRITALAISPNNEGGTNIFAGADGDFYGVGGVYLSTDNGANWKAINEFPKSSVNVIAINGNNIFAGTMRGGIYLSNDNGLSWKAVNNGLTDFCIYSIAFNGTNIFAGTRSGGVFLSTNNGSSWQAVNNGLPKNATVRTLSVSPNGTGGTNIIAGLQGFIQPIGSGGVFLSTDNGSSWNSVNNGLTETEIYTSVVSENNVFIGTINGVFRSTNNCLSWQKVNSGCTRQLFVSENKLFAAVNGGVFISTNNGTSWTSVNNGLTNLSINSVASYGNNVFAGTDAGVSNSNDNGANWSDVKNGLNSIYIQSLLVCPSQIGENLILAGTYFKNGIFLSTDNGANWNTANGFTNRDVTTLAFSPNGTGGNNIFAGTDLGIFLSTSNGTSWTVVNNGLTNYSELNVSSLVSCPNEAGGNNIFAGTSGGVFLSTNNGTSWAAVNKDGLTTLEVTALALKPNGLGGNNLILGTSNGVFLSTNNGTSWSAARNNLFRVKSFTIIENNIFAGSGSGLFLSTDNGFSWTEVSGLTPLEGQYSPVYVKSMVSKGNNIFAGTSNGIFLSTNNGLSWSDVSSGLTNTDISALAISGNNIFAGLFGSSVWYRPIAEIIASINKAPVANAGIEQTVDEGTTVLLDGSASSDPDGNSLTYKWTAPAGITLSSTTVSKPTFTAPEVSANTNYTFSLVVNDGAVDSPEDQVVITVKNVNKIPVAIAGIDQSVNEGATITLDGSASSDPDGNPLTYKWTAPAGITLSSISAAKPTFTAPEVKKDSTLNFSLLVNDGFLNSTPAAVKVTVMNVIKVGVSTFESRLIKVYPNPTTGIINIEISDGTGRRMEVLVTSLVGTEVFRKEITDAANIQIDLSNQVNGIYLLKVFKGNREYISKIIMTRQK